MKKYTIFLSLVLCAVSFAIADSVTAANFSLWSPSVVPGMPASTDAQQVELGGCRPQDQCDAEENL